MMLFWSYFAKTGRPGVSSNGVEWTKYSGQENAPSSYMILDNRKNLRMDSGLSSFTALIKDLNQENALSDLEKCVVLLQMLTYVGNDLYYEYADNFSGECNRSKSEQFIKDNASFIDY